VNEQAQDSEQTASTPWGEDGGEAHGQSPLGATGDKDAFAERPEVFVGAAFAGGFAIAQILKRFGHE
jgi:hypothetical protein